MINISFRKVWVVHLVKKYWVYGIPISISMSKDFASITPVSITIQIELYGEASFQLKASGNFSCAH